MFPNTQFPNIIGLVFKVTQKLTPKELNSLQKYETMVDLKPDSAEPDLYLYVDMNGQPLTFELIVYGLLFQTGNNFMLTGKLKNIIGGGTHLPDDLLRNSCFHFNYLEYADSILSVFEDK